MCHPTNPLHAYPRNATTFGDLEEASSHAPAGGISIGHLAPLLFSISYLPGHASFRLKSFHASGSQANGGNADRPSCRPAPLVNREISIEIFVYQPKMKRNARVSSIRWYYNKLQMTAKLVVALGTNITIEGPDHI
jgi:hypothetical protein